MWSNKKNVLEAVAESTQVEFKATNYFMTCEIILNNKFCSEKNFKLNTFIN